MRIDRLLLYNDGMTILSPGTDDVATVYINIESVDTSIIYNWADGFQINYASGFFSSVIVPVIVF